VRSVLSVVADACRSGPPNGKHRGPSIAAIEGRRRRSSGPPRRLFHLARRPPRSLGHRGARRCRLSTSDTRYDHREAVRHEPCLAPSKNEPALHACSMSAGSSASTTLLWARNRSATSSRSGFRERAVRTSGTARTSATCRSTCLNACRSMSGRVLRRDRRLPGQDVTPPFQVLGFRGDDRRWRCPPGTCCT